MGLFSDITSALGSIFGNNTQPSSDPNDPLKKKQNAPNPTPTPLVSQKINMPAPLKVSAPMNLAPRAIVPTVAPPVNTSNLTAQPVAPPQSTQQPTSLFGHLLNAAKDVEGAVGTGIPEAALRVGEGLASSAVDVPNIAVHAVTKPIRMIAGPNSPLTAALNTENQQTQRVTNDVNDPINALAKQTNLTAQSGNAGARAVYKPAQIVGNVATIVPGGVEAATKLPVIGDDIARGLSKIPGISIGKTAEATAGIDTSRVADEAAPTTENPTPETGTKAPDETKPTNAPTGETAEPTPAQGATESGVKPGPTPPEVDNTPAYQRLPAQQTAPVVPATPEEAPVPAPAPVIETPQAPVVTPTPAVAPPPSAPAIAPGQAASEAEAASPEQQAVVDEAANNEPAYKRGKPTTVGQAAAQAKLGVFNAPDETFSANARARASAEPAPTPKTDIPSYIKKDPDTVIAKAKDDIATIDKKLDSLGTGNNLKFKAKQDLAKQLRDHPNARPAIIKGYQRKLGAYDEASVATTRNSLLAERQQAQSLMNMAQRAKDLPEDEIHAPVAPPAKAVETPKDTSNVEFKQTDNPLAGETPPANPYGIEPIAGLDDETAASGGTKAQLNEGDKLLSPRAQLSKVGAAGRQLLQLFRNKEFNEGRLITAMENDTPTFHDLSPKDQELAADVVRGTATSDRPEINQAVKELQTHFKNVEQASEASGVPVEHRENYIPQMLKSDFLEKKSNIKQLIQNLMNKGDTEEQATTKVNTYISNLRSRPNIAGHLELPREFENPQPFHSKELRAYNEQAASRIAEAQHYGPKNEELDKLIAKAAQNGEDVNQIKQITEDYMHPKPVSKGALSKLATGVRGVTNVALLPKAALSHTFQGLANTGSDVGFTKYFKALGNRVFSSDEKDFINESGIKNISTQERSPLDKVTAPGLKQLRSFHQQVAVLAGKYHADALAAKGDEAGLRNIGVTGDLTRDADGKIQLTRTQQLQAGKVESDKSIFSDSSLETSKALKGNTGKAIGQFRTAYVAKQGGRIVDLVKQARNGDVAPLLRYLAVGAPIGGVGVTALKNLYKTGNPNPFPSGTSAKSDVLNAAQNSGIESVGFGAPESAINAVRYNYNNNDRVNNAAGAISPIAGIATETGQNIDQALRGNKSPLIKQGASYTIVPKVGSMIDKKYAPTKTITPTEQKYLNIYGPAYSKLINTVNPFNKSATNQNTEITNTIKGLTSNDHNAQGQMIQKSPAETQAQWTTIAGLPPKAQAAYIQFQKSLPNHSPAYDLTGNGVAIDKNGNQSPASKFQIYANYEKDLPGSAERSQLEAMNPWLTKTFAAEQALYNSSSYKSTSVPYNGPLPGGLTEKDLQYPTLTSQQNDLMTQETQLSSIPAANRTPAQITQLTDIENNPELQKAYTALDNYTNAQRVARGAPPLKLAPNASPAVQAAINAYDALPPSKSDGNTDPATSGERSAWITAHPALYAQMQNYYASADMSTIAKQGAEDELEGNAPSQSLLGAIKSEGSDILSTKNANGTTSYSINPAAADAQSYGSSYQSASDAAYDRDKAAGLSDLGTKYATKADDKGLKADTTLKYKAPKLLADKAPGGKDGNPFVKAVSSTKGVKVRKGGDNPFAYNISITKGVKSA